MAILDNAFKKSYNIFVCSLFAEESIPIQKATISQSIQKQNLSIKFVLPIEVKTYIIYFKNEHY